MMATRSFGLAAVRYVRPAHGIILSSSKNLPKLQPITAIWMRPCLAATYSKDAKTADITKNVVSTPLTELPLKSNNPPLTSVPPTKNMTASSSSSSPAISAPKTQKNEHCTGTLDEVGIKFPSRAQVEGFVFKSLVYLWDFAYYLFCLCRKLIEKYIVKNSFVQENWKQLQKRMDDARKELKPK